MGKQPLQTIGNHHWPIGTSIRCESRAFTVPFMTVEARVVHDDDRYLADYIEPGTDLQCLVPVDAANLPRVLSQNEFDAIEIQYISRPWQNRHTLVIGIRGSAHAVYGYWGLNWEFQNWYVNLQTPFGRTGDTLSTTDQFLDILVVPDGTWSWKDDDELELAVAKSRLTRSDADQVRSEGWRVIADIESGVWWIDLNFRDWRPPVGWPFRV